MIIIGLDSPINVKFQNNAISIRGLCFTTSPVGLDYICPGKTHSSKDFTLTIDDIRQMMNRVYPKSGDNGSPQERMSLMAYLYDEILPLSIAHAYPLFNKKIIQEIMSESYEKGHSSGGFSSFEYAVEYSDFANRILLAK